MRMSSIRRHSKVLRRRGRVMRGRRLVKVYTGRNFLGRTVQKKVGGVDYSEGGV